MSKSSELGAGFEALTARLTGSTQQPQSGAGKWYKMDVRGRTILWSCKASAQESGVVSVKKTDLAEVREAARSAAGTGDIPAMAVMNGDEVGVYMSLDDFVELMASDVTIPRTKSAERRRNASIPSALR